MSHRELRVLSQGTKQDKKPSRKCLVNTARAMNGAYRESSNRRWDRHHCADTDIDPGTGIYLMSACYGGHPDSAARCSSRTGAVHNKARHGRTHSRMIICHLQVPNPFDYPAPLQPSTVPSSHPTPLTGTIVRQHWWDNQQLVGVRQSLYASHAHANAVLPKGGARAGLTLLEQHNNSSLDISWNARTCQFPNALGPEWPPIQRHTRRFRQACTGARVI